MTCSCTAANWLVCCLGWQRSQLRLLRIGLGLNVRNSGPCEGIALRRLAGQQAADPIRWTAEVLLALDHRHDLEAMGLVPDDVQARLCAISSFIPRMASPGTSQASIVMVLFGCVRVQGRRAGAGGPEVGSYP